MLKKNNFLTYENALKINDPFEIELQLNEINNNIHLKNEKIINTGQYNQIIFGNLSGITASYEFPPSRDLPEKKEQINQKLFPIVKRAIKESDYRLHCTANKIILENNLNSYFLNLPISCADQNADHEFYEYSQMGDLTHCSQRNFEDLPAKYIMAQIILAIEELHKKQIAHFDIKLENFLMFNINGKTRVKLIDFDGMRKLDENNKPSCSFIYSYLPPEAKFTMSYDVDYDLDGKAFDCYTLGMLLINFTQFLKNKNNPALVEMIEGLLEDDPKKRWTIWDVKRSPFFDIMNEETKEVKKNPKKNIFRVIKEEIALEKGKELYFNNYLVRRFKMDHFLFQHRQIQAIYNSAFAASRQHDFLMKIFLILNNTNSKEERKEIATKFNYCQMLDLQEKHLKEALIQIDEGLKIPELSYLHDELKLLKSKLELSSINLTFHIIKKGLQEIPEQIIASYESQLKIAMYAAINEFLTVNKLHNKISYGKNLFVTHGNEERIMALAFRSNLINVSGYKEISNLVDSILYCKGKSDKRSLKSILNKLIHQQPLFMKLTYDDVKTIVFANQTFLSKTFDLNFPAENLKDKLSAHL